MSLLEKMGLYIHVPFCTSKCNYCDFNSYAGKLDLAQTYFNSMKKEIELYKDQLNYHLIDTIFIGGGTPSCVESDYIREVLQLCRESFNVSDNCEISIESNPGTLDEQKLDDYRAFGINRISIGLQACQDNLLEFLGRKHTAGDFAESVKIAKAFGFENVNADVIFGIPGQTMSDWRETLRRLVALETSHISAYSLKIEEGTRFGELLAKKELMLVDDEVDREMYHYAVKYLEENGYRQYELSNFAKEGYACRHNLIYWKCMDYLGLGAGAHSYLDSMRFSNFSSIEKYIHCLDKGEKPVAECIPLDFCNRMSEYMFLGMRLTAGVDGHEFESIFHQNMFEKYSEVFKKLEKKKLIEIGEGYVKLTPLGLDMANQVFVEFV